MNSKTIYVFGDSLVYGVGDSQEGGWVSRLQSKLKEKYNLRNYGIPGDHSGDLLERINEECKEKKPDIIIFSIGANDSQYKEKKEVNFIKLKTFKENLGKLFTYAKKITPEIIFVGLPRMNDSVTTKWNFAWHFCNKNLEKYDSEIKNFCEKNNLQYIPIYDLMGKGDLSDGAHPNNEGYKKIAERIQTFL